MVEVGLTVWFASGESPSNMSRESLLWVEVIKFSSSAMEGEALVVSIRLHARTDTTESEGRGGIGEPAMEKAQVRLHMLVAR